MGKRKWEQEWKELKVMVERGESGHCILASALLEHACIYFYIGQSLEVPQHMREISYVPF